jgi:maltose/moltooligosaccharide transporter
MSTKGSGAAVTVEAGRFNWPRTFLLGFGFLGVSVIWSLYNAYMPIFLQQDYHLSGMVTGWIMAIDNILAIVLLPFLGALSDRTRTRLGRRRPYILVGSIVATVLFLLIPWARSSGLLWAIMVTLSLLNLSMAVFRTPVIALMPDITAPKFRSQANGIINFMGGVGSLLAFFGGGPLYETDNALPFIVGGLVMLGACLLVVVFIREPAVAGTSDPSPGTKKPLSLAASAKELVGNLKDVFTGEKSLLFILLAIFCWFVGYNAVETFFTSYAKFHLGLTEKIGTQILGYFSAVFMITAIASGFLGSRFGRKNTIRMGLIVVAAVMLSALFIRSRWPLTAAFLIGGFGWGLVNVNSLPMVVDMTTLAKVGGYTGLYYFFSQAANIVAPPLAGALKDRLGWPSLMYFAAVMFVAAIVIVSFVRRGDVKK